MCINVDWQFWLWQDGENTDAKAQDANRLAESLISQISKFGLCILFVNKQN